MSGFRFMRMIVFFDLPTLTLEQRRGYNNFRKTMIKAGFVMMQESVYSRMLTSPSMEYSMKHMLHECKPKEGLIQVMTLTEKQFAKIEYIVGEYTTDVITSSDGVIVL